MKCIIFDVLLFGLKLEHIMVGFIQAYHRDILELKHTVVPLPSLTEVKSENSPPAKIVRTKNVKQIRKVKHGRYKSGTRSVNGRDTSSF